MPTSFSNTCELPKDLTKPQQLIANAYVVRKVLRYSALFAGVGYGLYHQATINTQTRKQKIDAQYHHQSDLISKAKVEWMKKTTPSSQKTADAGGMF